MSIELTDDWVLCHSKCGKYKGYFKVDAVPPDYVESDKVWISASDFIKHFDLVDTCFDRAWEQSEHYFKNKHSPLQCEFETVELSEDTFKNHVASALLSDVDRIIVSYGAEYEDWYYIDSILRRRDFYIVGTHNNYCIDEALSDLGLPSLEKLQEISTEDLSYSVVGNAYKFTLKNQR